MDEAGARVDGRPGRHVADERENRRLEGIDERQLLWRARDVVVVVVADLCGWAVDSGG